MAHLTVTGIVSSPLHMLGIEFQGVGISEFGSLGVSTPHLVTLLFGLFLVYTVAIFVVTPHSFVTLHHHELVRPRLGRDFPHKAVVQLT